LLFHIALEVIFVFIACHATSSCVSRQFADSLTAQSQLEQDWALRSSIDAGRIASFPVDFPVDIVSGVSYGGLGAGRPRATA